MSTKGLTKDLIQKDSIPKGVKYWGKWITKLFSIPTSFYILQLFWQN